MALAPYLVKIPATRAVNNVTALIVAAENEAGAIAAAGAFSTVDRPGQWDLAEVTAIEVGESAGVLASVDGTI